MPANTYLLQLSTITYLLATYCRYPLPIAAMSYILQQLKVFLLQVFLLQVLRVLLVQVLYYRSASAGVEIAGVAIAGVDIT